MAELPPSTQQILFARSVILTFQLWPSMRAAISQEWGGADSQDKCDFIISHICDTYGGPPGSTSLGRHESTFDYKSPSSAQITPPPAPETPDQDDLAETLEGYLADEFDARIEDESCDYIASRIAALHKKIFAQPDSDTLEAAQRVREQAEAEIRPMQEQADKQKASGRRETDRYTSQPGFESDSDDDDDGSDSDGERRPNGGDAMDVDRPAQPKPKQEPIVDDEGFTTVQRKR